MKIFEDMFSSHRGAGVIGSLVAVGVLVALCSLFILVFDEDFQGGEKTIESVIRDQGKQIEELSTAITKREEQLSGIAKNQKTVEEIESVTWQIKSKINLCNKAKEQIARLYSAKDELQSIRATYLIAYRKAERASEIGKFYREITTKSGRTYKGVKIKKIDDLRVSVSHEEGSGNIAWNELPDDMIDRLQFSGELADQQMKVEHGAAAHIAASAQEYDIKSSMAFVKEKMAEATSVFDGQKALVNQSQSKIIECQNQIRNLERLIIIEANKSGLRQTPRYRSQIEDNEKTIEAERTRMADFAIIQQNHDETMRDLNAQWVQLSQKLQKIPK